MIEQMNVYWVEMPMRRQFSHAIKTRTHSDTVLLSFTICGITGTGECAPRPYVTGETVEGTLAMLAGLDVAKLDRLVNWQSFDTAVASLALLDLKMLLAPSGKASRAAACAVELALLDTICRIHGQPMCRALEAAGVCDKMVHSVPRPVHAVQTFDLSISPGAIVEQISLPQNNARHIKLKATQDLSTSLERAQQFRSLFGSRTTMSVDANGSWTLDDAVYGCRRLNEWGFAWIEEPLRARDWPGLNYLRRESGLPIMLDESFVDSQDMDVAVHERSCDLVNVRVSKCGGPIQSARLAQRAIESGLRYQLGVQVAEIGPLWAAGRMLATSLQHSSACEVGRIDEWFPPEITVPSFPIDRATYIAPPLVGVGHGIELGPLVWANAHKAFSRKIVRPTRN